MLDAHAYAMQVNLCKANTEGVTIPNTHPIHLINGFLGSPLVQLRNRGSAQPLTLRESTPLGGQSHLGLTPMASRTSLLPPGCAVSLFGSRPELSYSASRSERVIRPTK